MLRNTREFRPGCEGLEDRCVPAVVQGPDLTFVARAYRDILGREASRNDLNYWANVIAQFGSRAAVAGAIANSTEAHVGAVRSIYRQVLGRDADANGLNFFVNALDSGASQVTVRASLAASEEFFARQGRDNLFFVRGAYTTLLGRAVDDAALAFWKIQLERGVSRAEVTAQIAGSDEALLRSVQSLYRRFLRRNADGSGLVFFSALLSVSADEDNVTGALVGSGEYAFLP